MRLIGHDGWTPCILFSRIIRWTIFFQFGVGLLLVYQGTCTLLWYFPQITGQIDPFVQYSQRITSNDLSQPQFVHIVLGLIGAIKPTRIIVFFLFLMFLITVDANDIATLGIRPLIVEQCGVACIAHLTNALCETFPSDRFSFYLNEKRTNKKKILICCTVCELSNQLFTCWLACFDRSTFVHCQFTNSIANCVQ